LIKWAPSLALKKKKAKRKSRIGLLPFVGVAYYFFNTMGAPRTSKTTKILTPLMFFFNRFTGSGIGTLTFGPVLQYILERYGLAISLRILSGVTLLLLVVALTYKPFRSPIEEMFEVKRQPAPFFDLSIWQNKAFCVYTAAVALFMLGYFIPYVHLVGSPHCFIPIPLGGPVVLFPPFLSVQPSLSLLQPGSSHRFVSGN